MLLRRGGAGRRRFESVVVASVLALVIIAPPTRAAGMPAERCDGDVATIQGTEGPDLLVGTEGPDVIVGLGGDDVIRGRGGDDRVCGGAGADRLYGGGGHDRVFGEADGDPYGDWFIDGRGNDYYAGGLGESLDRMFYRRDRAGIVADLQTGTVTGDFAGTDTHIDIDLFFASRHVDTITGSALSDHIWSGRGGDVIDGNGGDNDSVHGGAGADSIMNAMHQYGERGDDTLQEGGPVMQGGLGNDHLIGNSALSDKLEGEAGNDWLEGLGGDDRLVGDVGNDLLDGGSGRDRGLGDFGTDTCINIEVRRECEA